MNAPAFKLEHRQNQVLTPRLQQAVRLLQLSSLDFAQELQQTLSINPFLEMDDNLDDYGEEFNEDDAFTTPEENAAEQEPAEFELDPPQHDVLETISDTHEHDEVLDPFPDTEPWGQHGEQRHGGDSELDLLDLAPAEQSLHEHLHSQINTLRLSERDQILAALVIEALDEDGYLRVDLEELRVITEQEGMEPAVEAAEMQFALKLVQSMEPAGVGCRDVQECILLQLEALEPCEERELALRIAAEEFKRLSQRDINGLAHLYGCKPVVIERVCNYIRRLDPRPGWRFGNQSASYLTPDVIVRKVRGEWTAMLNPSAVPKIRLNQVYAELFQSHRESHHSELASHLQEARWTVRNVEQRFNTILRVAQAVVERQWHFFEYGTLAMQPLGLKDIAEELDLHESTVSRATSNKYMATPAGVFELKYFFSRALATDQGSSCSTTAIRGAIKEMIQAENGHAPLSDAEITRRLTKQGLQVARRTVTKYRQMMHIPPVDMRRQHA
ncbi:RNA polymerase factor sigma-54 [Chitinimonas lacunae]|uniref:RNA polymerase sigma-54 factor n=1 Tax=Chitinimonas lacunae TaxID=1963018 RepID=A0ABV8MMZ8_9NEIS